MLHVHVSDAQRQELAAVSRQAVGRVAWRAHMVLLSERGDAVPVIAAIQAGGTDVVRTWLPRYAPPGVAGWEDQARSGRPPKDQLAGPLVDAQARHSPRGSGHGPACWSVARRAAFLARRVRLGRSRSSNRRYLHPMGGR
jgi:transposase